ncbi:energy transducer TonB family protein [Actinobacillus suis]|uniref:Protein TonB n=2 Tax=Actinobacillus suis TaxID=716 RepID=K0G5X8_ACTSU|nr:energy transducer TonB [Actinobacillus suis]AAW21310.1 TonB2 [Actinobacillus suis]AAW21313.1 TonB2 [Actinobacillus suis]AFU19498.1 TobB energy transducing protein [Actinobacillus suis H91-0380]MCO4166400.1 energy transducer TonB [Actinobacillus suis]MCO4168726.1 energy transducer TonB [Actinobacillus suis]
MKKKHSRIGLISSIVIHTFVFAGFISIVKSSHSDGQPEDNVMSMELVAALLEQPQVAVAEEQPTQAEPEKQQAEPEPEPEAEPIPEPKPQPKPKEKPKEKPKPKEQPKPKEKEKPKKEKAKDKPIKALEKGPEAKQGIVAKAIPNAVQGTQARAGIPNGKPNGNPNGTSANGSQNGAAGGSGSGSNGSEIGAYKAALQRALQRRANNAYPAREKMMRKTGVVTIGFTVSSSGDLTNVKVLNSSGNSNLDNAAVKAAQSTKVSPPPAGFPSSVTVPVKFSIE